MAYPVRKLQAILIAAFLASSAMASAARVLDNSKLNLTMRLKLDQPGKLSSCWDALFQLQSCSGELVLFFMNGEMHLGAGCCSAIRTIEYECWPSILRSLGITPEESDILLGYCDATAAALPPVSPCSALTSLEP